MLRRLFFAALILGVILFGGVLFVIFKSDDLLAHYKPDIESYLSAKLGQPVTLRDPKITFLPRVKVTVSDIQLSQGETGLSFGRIAFIPEIGALFASKFRVDSFEASDGTIRLPGSAKRQPMTFTGVTLEGNFGGAGDAVKVSELRAHVTFSPKVSFEALATNLDYQFSSGRATVADLLLQNAQNEIHATGSYQRAEPGFDLVLRWNDFKSDLLRDTLEAFGVIWKEPRPDGVLAGRATLRGMPNSLALNGETKAFLTTRKEQLDGKLNLAFSPFRGEIKVSSQALSPETVKKHFPDFVSAIDSYALSGTAAPQVLITFKPGVPTQVSGKVAFTKLAARISGVPLHEGSGTVHFAPGERGFSITFQDLTAKHRESGELVKASGTLDTKPFGGKLQVRSDQLTLKTLKPFLGETHAIEGTLKPDLTLTLAQGRIQNFEGTVNIRNGAIGLESFPIESLNGDITLRSQVDGGYRASARGLPFKVRGEELRADFSLDLGKDRVVLQDLVLAGLSGKITAQFQTGLQDPKPFRASFQATGTDLSKTLRTFFPKATLQTEGKLELLEAKLSGNLTAFDVHRLDAEGQVKVTDALLKNVNLGRMVLEKLGEIPLIGTAFISQIPPQFSRYLTGTDTPIKHFSTPFLIHGGKVDLKDLRLVSDVYGITGGGNFTAEGELDFGLDMVCDEGLSFALVRGIRELSVLLTGNSLLRIPFSLSGHYPDVNVRPDVSGIFSRGAGRVIQKGLGGLLDGVLGK